MSVYSPIYSILMCYVRIYYWLTSRFTATERTVSQRRVSEKASYIYIHIYRYKHLNTACLCMYYIYIYISCGLTSRFMATERTVSQRRVNERASQTSGGGHTSAGPTNAGGTKLSL